MKNEIEQKASWKYKNDRRWLSVTKYRGAKHNGVLKKPKPKDRLSVRFPQIAKEWHTTKNGNLTPNDVSYGSHLDAHWICKKMHEWVATVNGRTNRNSSCPYCSNKLIDAKNCLAFIHPEIAKEWHPTKNGKLTPYDVFPRSNEMAWWIDKNGHEWKATVASRSAGHGCPYCSGHKMSQKNCLANVNPHLLDEWDYERNKGIDPYSVSYGSRTKAHWKCKKNGHLWAATIKSRSKGCGCPKCRGYVLKDGRHFNSLLDIWFFKELKRQKKKFLYNQVYPRVGNKKLGKKGLMRYDFYLPEDKKYIEVTSYAPKYCIDIKQYRSYLRTIKKKKKYVEEVLDCEFQFVQKRLTREEIKFVKKYIE